MKAYFIKAFGGVQNFVMPILLFFAPVKGVLITVGMFILLDTMSGLWKSKKKGIPITSVGLSSAVSKLLLYQFTVLTMFCMDVFIMGDVLEGWFSIEFLGTKVVAMLLIYVEAKSINENYKAIRGIDLWEEFKKFISRTKEIKDDISDITKK